MSLVQVGWRSRVTGEICDCPVYERSPHANSDPVYVDSDASGNDGNALTPSVPLRPNSDAQNARP